MRVFKPSKVGLLHRVVEQRQRYFWHVAGLLYMPLDNTKNLLPEAAMWPFVAPVLGKEAPLDEMVGKQSAEFLVAGSAFVPGGAAARGCQVKVKVGKLEKALLAIGDRRWTSGGPTEPEPFSTLPVTWERAFGGEGWAKNPSGKGFAPITGPEGSVHPLPNVETPGKLIRARGDRPDPAGFMPIPVPWPQRTSRAGTYDRRYLKEDFPGLARDADWRFYNMAPPDQWAEGFFGPEESFEVQHMHPTRPRLEGRLPNAAVRIFVTQRTDAGERFTEVPTHIDTLWLFPQHERVIAVYRGVLEVAEDDQEDIEHLMLGCEDLSAPKDLAHYREVLAARLDEKRAPMAVLREQDLMPGWPSVPLEETKDCMAAVYDQGLLLQNQHKRGVREALRARAAAVDAGLDPDEHTLPIPKPIPPRPAPHELDEFFRKAEEDYLVERAKIEKHAAEHKAKFRELFADAGLDYATLEREASGAAGGPPKPMAAQVVAKMAEVVALAREQGAELADIEEMMRDEAVLANLANADAGRRQNYIELAHRLSAAERLPPERNAPLRAEVERRLGAGESLAALDLTGADLHGLSFCDADLEVAFLEASDLRDCDFSRARLGKAVLTRADLTNAKFDGAHLEGANLGCVSAPGASFRGAMLKGAVLYQADVAGVSFEGANLDEADLMEAKLQGADLRGARAAKLFIYKADLSGLDLRGADLPEATFMESELGGVDFSEAKLEKLSLIMTKAANARFTGAKMTNARIVLDSDCTGADFRGAEMSNSNLRATPLAGADFSGATLHGADLSKCNLEQARFVRANARGARFVRAKLCAADLTAVDLMDAVLQKADLRGARFTDANLFQADVSLTHIDASTVLEGSNQTRLRVDPARKKK